MNTFDEMRAAVQDARTKIQAADSVVGAMAAMVVGRLRQSAVSGSVLTALKKELADWNMHTQKWSKK